jgi:hypothetical protein
MEKTARCIVCNAEFTDEEIKNANKCPKCGNSGAPANPKDDVTVKINWHELKILCTWAEFHATNMREATQINPMLIVACIAKRLQRQYPKKQPLTLGGELSEMKKIPGLKIVDTNINNNPDKIAGEFNA